MSETTRHGQNIADQIQTDDAYGDYNNLTNADVWNILDNIHTHMCDTRDGELESLDPIFDILETAMMALETIDPDLPV